MPKLTSAETLTVALRIAQDTWQMPPLMKYELMSHLASRSRRSMEALLDLNKPEKQRAVRRKA